MLTRSLKPIGRWDQPRPRHTPQERDEARCDVRAYGSKILLSGPRCSLSMVRRTLNVPPLKEQALNLATSLPIWPDVPAVEMGRRWYVSFGSLVIRFLVISFATTSPTSVNRVFSSSSVVNAARFSTYNITSVFPLSLFSSIRYKSFRGFFKASFK